MTRKEFLSVVTALFGLALLSKLPFAGGTKRHAADAPGTYGNHVYGGNNNQ